MDNNQQGPILIPEQSATGIAISKRLLMFNGILLISIIGMVFIIYGALHKSIGTKADSEERATTKVFQNIALLGKAAYVYDVSKNQMIFEKNSLSQLPLASLTKIMTALTAVELFPKDSHITIKKEFLQEEGDTGLLSEESWKLKNLIDFSLVASSNDGARSLASVIGAFDLKTEDYDLGRQDFIAKMNSRAKELGLEQTYFINESGLDEASVSGGYGSAFDVAKLIEYILTNKPDLLEATKYKKLTIDSFNTTHVATNTNDGIADIPGLLVSKTGYTELAGGNLAIAFDASIGRPIIVVVLGSTEEGRFMDVQTLVNATLAYLRE